MNVPISWQQLELENVTSLQQLASAGIKILAGFIVPDNLSPVIFYDYGRISDEFMELYDKHLSTMAKIDRFVDGDPDSFDYEDTSIDKPIFYNYFKNDLGCFYVAVIKHFLKEDLNTYTIQAFINKDNRLFMGQTTITNFSEQDPIKTLESDEIFNNILTCLADL